MPLNGWRVRRYGLAIKVFSAHLLSCLRKFLYGLCLRCFDYGKIIFMESKPIYFNYVFKFGDESEKRFDVRLDSETLNLIRQPKESYPEWADLNFFKCPNCTLVYCPLINFT